MLLHWDQQRRGRAKGEIQAGLLSSRSMHLGLSQQSHKSGREVFALSPCTRDSHSTVCHVPHTVPAPLSPQVRTLNLKEEVIGL